MESQVIEALAAGGSTAILALFIFLMYRRDRKASSEAQRVDRVFMEDRLTKIIEEDQTSRRKNTAALTELTTVLRTMNNSKKG